MTESETMVERVARAIYAVRLSRRSGKKARSWGELSPKWQVFWMKQARAAIAAMREPTKAMRSAIRNVEPLHSDLSDIWNAGIDAALSDSSR